MNKNLFVLFLLFLIETFAISNITLVTENKTITRTIFVPIYTNTIIENITSTFNVIVNLPQQSTTINSATNASFSFFYIFFLIVFLKILQYFIN